MTPRTGARDCPLCHFSGSMLGAKLEDVGVVVCTPAEVPIMPAAEPAIHTAWISVHDRLPSDSRECVLICIGPRAKGDPIEKLLGFRFQNEWIILAPELKSWEVRYWLPLPDMP